MNRAERRDRAPLGGSNIVLLLSLNLILLAFFILLNALSEFEEDRTRAVLESVNRTFSGKIEPSDSTEAIEGSLGALAEAEDMVRAVGSLFKAIIPSSRSSQTRQALSVRIELPATALFRPGKSRLRRERSVLIRRLAGLLTRKRVNIQGYRLEVLLGIRRQAGELTSRSLEVRRATELAHRLEDAGLPSTALAIGVMPGLPGAVHFVLTMDEAVAAAAGSGSQPE